MTRTDAIRLLDTVVDAGFSCALSVEVHKAALPLEHATVTVPVMRLTTAELQRLIAIADERRVELHITGEGGIEFLDLPAPPPEAKRR